MDRLPDQARSGPQEIEGTETAPLADTIGSGTVQISRQMGLSEFSFR